MTAARTCAALETATALAAVAHRDGVCAKRRRTRLHIVVESLPRRGIASASAEDVAATPRVTAGSSGKKACVCSCSYPTSAMRRKYTASHVTRPSTAAHIVFGGLSASPDVFADETPSPGERRPEVS